MGCIIKEKETTFKTPKYVVKSEPIKPPEKTKSSYETEQNLNNSQINIMIEAE